MHQRIEEEEWQLKRLAAGSDLTEEQQERLAFLTQKLVNLAKPHNARNQRQLLCFKIGYAVRVATDVAPHAP